MSNYEHAPHGAMVRVGDEPWWYSLHAIRRMRERGITTKQVTEAILEPSWRCAGSNLKGKNSFKYVKNTAAGQLHVGVAIVEGVTIVVSIWIKGPK